MLNRSLTSTFDRVITLNRAIDETLAANGNGNAHRIWVPALDIVEKPDAYPVLAELPGVERSQVDLSFEKNVLTIRGTKGSEGRVLMCASLRPSASAESLSAPFGCPSSSMATRSRPIS